ncbi:MAG: energy transducer TonB [Alphaproteobacteria bacterium]|nr:energy transducer TonB [Alphaproteobacteria bacterium]MBM3640576.1 energy transducer TonB [Alphaproteobacteria bacterium]
MSAAAALQNPQSNRKLWGVAVAFAMLLHVGGAVAAFLNLQGDDEEASGAPAIEISLEPAAPRDAEAADLPPGPVADEAAAAAPSAAASEAKEMKEERITHAEAEEAEFTHNATPDKRVEEEKKVQAQPVLSSESAASEATAPPKSEVEQTSDKPVSPVQGADVRANAIKLTWQKALLSHLNRHKRYPVGGGRRSAEASVSFTLDRLGHVVSYSIKRSAGHPAFDDAALAMMKRADPVPPPPPGIADEGLTFEVPVQFRAGGK